MKNKFLVLWLAGLAGAAAVLPYAFTLQKDVVAQVPQPMFILVIASIFQTAILLAVTCFIGLKLSNVTQLPVLTNLGTNIPYKERYPNFVRTTLFAGILTSILITIGDKIFSHLTPQITIANTHVAIWKTLLASLYGGTAEEILTRLFLVSLIAWLTAKIFRTTEPSKNNLIMWTAIIIAAILFGLGHLPITSAITTITPLVVLRAIILNGIGGVIFGWLYWKKGLEYAMGAHFVTDIFLLTLIPLIFSK